MNLIGRYSKVHRYLPHLDKSDGPYIVDHKNNYIEPVRDERWWKSKEGVWYPVPSGGVGNNWIGGGGSGSTLGYHQLNNVTITWSQLALDSAYVANTSGDAAAFSFVPTATKTLSTVYFDVDAYTGTAGNVTTLNFELRDDNGSNAPDVTVAALESKTFDPTSLSDRWLGVTGWTTELTAGQRYWIIIADADGNGTDYARVKTAYSASEDDVLYKENLWLNGATSNDGFATILSRFSKSAVGLLIFSDSTTFGIHPYNLRVSISADNNEKGNFYGQGLGNGNARIVGIQFMTNSNNDGWENIHIWEGAELPTGTPWATSVEMIHPSANNSGFNGAIFSGTHSGGGYPKLAHATDYRITLNPGAAENLSLITLSITPVTNAEIRACAPGKGNFYYTQENGSAWTDTISSIAPFGILFADWKPDVASSGSGGTGRTFPVFPA